MRDKSSYPQEIEPQFICCLLGFDKILAFVTEYYYRRQNKAENIGATCRMNTRHLLCVQLLNIQSKKPKYSYCFGDIGMYKRNILIEIFDFYS